jgi:hypothetical protein
MGCLVAVGLVTPANAAGTTQISGSRYCDDAAGTECGTAPAGFADTVTSKERFEAKNDPDVFTGIEVNGRCQHPIAAGSGTGGFAGATGRLDFKDDVDNAVFYYRGHVKLG